MTNTTTDRAAVQEYYGKVLQGNADLKTSACCLPSPEMPAVRRILDLIDPEIKERFYGCGSPLPQAVDGRTVLDLGCGTGRDVYICSRLVGPAGRVIGVDMTDEQLDVARRHVDPQTRRFGYDRPNVEFHKGYLEDLAAVGIADASVDVVISNCVINLVGDKQRVFSEIQRVLKPGGELLFADVFADRRIPAAWRDDKELLGECLAGAMYYEDFRRLMAGLGVPDCRAVAGRPIGIDDPATAAKVGLTRFFSRTVRAFKLASLEDRCEDFGQVAWYLGTIPHAPHAFRLDDHHEFVAGKPMLVCGNTASMLAETRLAPHFRVDGDRATHFGLFPCGPAAAAPDAAPSPSTASDGECCDSDCCC
jgi:SAM-dependent methyltransferase